MDSGSAPPIRVDVDLDVDWARNWTHGGVHRCDLNAPGHAGMDVDWTWTAASRSLELPAACDCSWTWNWSGSGRSSPPADLARVTLLPPPPRNHQVSQTNDSTPPPPLSRRSTAARDDDLGNDGESDDQYQGITSIQSAAASRCIAARSTRGTRSPHGRGDRGINSRTAWPPLTAAAFHTTTRPERTRPEPTTAPFLVASTR